MPVEFILFALLLAGVAICHRRALAVALAGLVAITAYKLAVTGFAQGAGVAGLAGLLAHESVTLANLLLLLTGFALVARHFEASGIPAVLPRILPGDWKGGFLLLAMVFVLSAFLDNIAAALIGGTMASAAFRGKVHIGYLAAIVAAANGGGAGSVVGDTTTTMMWIAGVDPRDVAEAFIGSGVALAIFGVIAARQQQAYAPIVRGALGGMRVDGARLAIVIVILVVAIGANVAASLRMPQLFERVPVLGLAAWTAILVTSPLRRPDWSVLPGSARGAVFLLSLVLAAAMMPVERLPPASWPLTFGLGFVSAVFDNIPLTALALRQGGYDWGFLAYAVGFGGSMIWFGSSAGVALAGSFPEARSVGAWLRHGWHVPVAYVAGFLVMLAVQGWQPHLQRTQGESAPAGMVR